MIVARSPLRITLGGVSTDIAAYYRDHGGFLLAAAIDQYVYVAVKRPFAPGITLTYSSVETYRTVDEVPHGILREGLRLFPADPPEIEIVTFSDVPHGTGLGSSGSFTTALLCALYAQNGISVAREELAEQACRIEIDRLGEPIGKQDQYAAAFGGLTCFTFARDGSVSAEPLAIDAATRAAFVDHILLFFTGATRSASNILRDQVALLERRDKAMVDNIHFEMENAFQSRAALEKGDLAAYARLLSAHWDMKRRRPVPVSNARIDALYELGLRNGALGGKLVGAGGGGFLMFCAHDAARLRQAMAAEGLPELRYGFDDDGGSRVVIR
jgi:D-glycero-alpha-D-manno-heptose-7-phosphate kinase